MDVSLSVWGVVAGVHPIIPALDDVCNTAFLWTLLRAVSMEGGIHDLGLLLTGFPNMQNTHYLTC